MTSEKIKFLMPHAGFIKASIIENGEAIEVNVPIKEGQRYLDMNDVRKQMKLDKYRQERWNCVPFCATKQIYDKFNALLEPDELNIWIDRAGIDYRMREESMLLFYELFKTSEEKLLEQGWLKILHDGCNDPKHYSIYYSSKVFGDFTPHQYKFLRLNEYNFDTMYDRNDDGKA